MTLKLYVSMIKVAIRSVIVIKIQREERRRMANSTARAVVLFFGIFLMSPIVRGQQPASSPDREPTVCLEFSNMASRANAVITQVEISEETFRRAYKSPSAIVRNPEKAFSVGDVEYLAAEADGKTMFVKFVTQKDKRTDFLKWYNGGGKKLLLSAGMNCLQNYNNDIRASKELSQLALLQSKSQTVWMRIVQADQFAEDGLRDALQGALKYVDAQSNQILILQQRYNGLVANVNAYSIAVDEYVATVNRLPDAQATMVPRLNFDFVRPRPITCTGDTNEFSKSASYSSGTSMLASASSAIHCEE
jgi:hypothetical protein